MKKYITVENLCCAHCGQKIENKTKKIKGVLDVKLSFMAEKMLVEYKDDADFDAILAEIVKICKAIEPKTEVYCE